MIPVFEDKGHLAPVWCYYCERLPVVSVYNRPRIEVRVNRLLEVCIIKCEKMTHICCIIKRHLTKVVIQINTHPFGGFGRMYEVLLRVGAGFILAAAVALVPQHQSPETVLWAQADLLLPVDGGARHTEAPRCLGPNLHLPVMCAGGEGFSAQDNVVAGEALGVVWKVRLELSHLDTCAARRNPKAGVGCVWVQVYSGDS